MSKKFRANLVRAFVLGGLLATLCAFVGGRGVTANDNMALGNPSQATTSDRNNLLIVRPEYALSYDRATGGPNWVSWHLDAADLGELHRSNDFRPDPLLPPDCRIRPTAYRDSGYDRGHQCPSGDRTANAQENSDTFLMSNMLPQTADLNRELWRKFEEFCRSETAGGADELYIYSGGQGSLGTIDGGQVNVPAWCWKVAVVLPSGNNDLRRINADTRVIAVLMPNQNSPQVKDGAWQSYITSAANIDRLTGLKLLGALPEPVRTKLLAHIDSGAN